MSSITKHCLLSSAVKADEEEEVGQEALFSIPCMSSISGGLCCSCSIHVQHCLLLVAVPLSLSFWLQLELWELDGFEVFRDMHDAFAG